MSDFQQHPFVIQVYVPTGDPDGLRIMERLNWTGVGVVFNRTIYKEVASGKQYDKTKDFIKRTGVYVLVGESFDSNLPTLYVGEGDPVENRLNNHYINKDFWDWAVFFVAKDGSLNKAHVQHLESELLRLAREAKQCNLQNGVKPQLPTLSASESVFVNSFLNDMLCIFPLLGLKVFEKTESIQKPTDLLTIISTSIAARGYEDAKGFIVVKGSQLAKHEGPSLKPQLSIYRKDLLKQGIVKDEGMHFVFTQDQVFNSSSMAASVVLGRRSTGPQNWINSDGKSLKNLHELAVNQSEDNQLQEGDGMVAGKILVLELGVDGGGAAVFRTPLSPGVWQFHVEGNSMGLDDNDDEVWHSLKSQPFQTLKEAVWSISANGDWVLFYPISIHSDYQTVVWKLVQEAAQNLDEDRQKLWGQRRQNWQRLCQLES